MVNDKIVAPIMGARLSRLCLALVGSLACCGGCEAPGWFTGILGFRGDYILVASDSLVRPGEEVRIEARLREAEASWRPKPTGVYIIREGALLAFGKTDGNGVFAATFRPPAAGDYRFRVDCYAPQRDGNWPLRVEVLVACREANTPLLVVDIDQTLADYRRKRDVVFGEPNAAAGSVEAMGRLSRQCAVVYLTHRWDYLNRRTRCWLDARGYPPGPIFASQGTAIFEDNERYKARVLADLRSRFGSPGWGVGNLASDARAYASGGIRPILFLPGNEMTSTKQVRKALAELRAAPPAAQVVASWEEVERAVAEGASFPAEAAEARMRGSLKEMERRK